MKWLICFKTRTLRIFVTCNVRFHLADAKPNEALTNKS